VANRQVRLDPDVCTFVEQLAYEWDCSLSAATNRIVRDVRDEERMEQQPATVGVVAQVAAAAPKKPGRVPRGVNPRLAALLRANAGG
jgi:hypothetical protein